MNDLNPNFLVLLALVTASGALIAGLTGALVGVVLVCGVALAVSVLSGLGS